MKLFTRFFLILLVFSLAPVMLTGVWFLRSSARAQENTRQLHRQLTGLAADMVEASLAEMNRGLGFVEDLELGRARTPAGEYAILQRAALTHPAFLALGLGGPDGRLLMRVVNADVFPVDRDSLPSSSTVMAEALRTGKAVLGPVSVVGGAPLLPLAHPLSDGRCLYAAYGLEGVLRRVDRLRVGGRGRLILIDGEGNALGGGSSAAPPGGWARLGLSGEGGWLGEFPLGGEVMVGAFDAVATTGWKAVSLQPRAEAFAVGPRFQRDALIFLAVLGFIVAMGAYWFTGLLTRPILLLVEGARRVTRRDFGTPVAPLRTLELQLLSRGFNEMMGTLRAHEELQLEKVFSEKAKVDALVHTIPDGIVMAGFDGSILYMNSAARGLLGSEQASTNPRGLSVHDSIHDRTLREMVMSLLRREKRSASTELELKDPAGRRLGVFFCRAVAVMLKTREVGILLLMRDVSAERDLDRMKEEFFHSIVHDLRSPLTTIDGFMQLLDEGSGLGEREKTFINYVRQSSERLRQLISDILDTAKIESGQMVLKPEPFPAADVVARLRALYDVQAQMHGTTIEFQLASGAADSLVCDREFIERVLMNLIGNALKFTPRGGKVMVRIAAAEAGLTEFSVQDTGPGIPADKLEIVFEKFKQLEAGAAARSGYGLGLTICKKVVELHGGRIWAESAKGEGTRFAFRLPAGSIPRPAVR